MIQNIIKEYSQWNHDINQLFQDNTARYYYSEYLLEEKDNFYIFKGSVVIQNKKDRKTTDHTIYLTREEFIYLLTQFLYHIFLSKGKLKTKINGDKVEIPYQISSTSSFLDLPNFKYSKNRFIINLTQKPLFLYCLSDFYSIQNKIGYQKRKKL